MARAPDPETVEPNPADLIESLRDFGYTLPTAIADLVDNSLTAGATTIRCVVEPVSPKPHIVVLDDGAGMSADRLVEAMRMGARGPLTTRTSTDLGRFGLGLKTASLSIGRCLTVISKRESDSSPAIRRWDIEHIRKQRKWELLATPTALASHYLKDILAKGRGTAVVIEDLDRASFLNVSALDRESHLADALRELADHLGMVFHRFIDDGVALQLGSTAVRSWDPFLLGKSFPLSPDAFRFAGSDIVVAPFVLPHQSQLTDDDFERAAGVNGWNAHQGFYIYRCGRLIVPGTWLNLGLKKEEPFKLARIRVDLPNTLDAEWKLNVMKSHVAAPPALRDTFARIAKRARHDASNVYRHRGEREVTVDGGPPRGVWKRIDAKRKVRFRVDRAHPVLYALLNGPCGHGQLLADALSVVEQSLPIDSILQVSSKSLEGSVLPEDALSLDSLVSMVCAAESFYLQSGYTSAEARDRILSVDPLVRHRDAILARLSEDPASH